jgi:hypothetical protein
MIPCPKRDFAIRAHGIFRLTKQQTVTVITRMTPVGETTMGTVRRSLAVMKMRLVRRTGRITPNKTSIH